MTIFFIFHFFTIRNSDRALYKNIKQYTHALKSTQTLERQPSTQLRKDARKDIWTQERVHFQVNADHSKLTLRQKKDKVEASEELENITCHNPIGKIVAKHGSFEYPEQQFLANQVICSHALGTLEAQKATLSTDETLLLEDGVMLKSADFSLQSRIALCEIQDKKQQIEFFKEIVIETLFGAKATGDKAIYLADHLRLYPEKPNTFCHLYYLDNCLQSNEIDFDLKNETIHCTHSEGTFQNTLLFRSKHLNIQKDAMVLSENVHLEQKNAFSIDSDSCSMTLDEESASRIEINHNVRFYSPQENETFAVADTMIYYPKEQTLILSAIAPKRVLFWQQGVRLSAPEIHIHQQQFEGKGDVRFTFNLEEQGMIDHHISKYLHIPFL
ncbi:MAG TPA: hypothetical protein VLE96_01340 [Chlamydiales bacterium]|nr:hypothetical protein [Chlamydiales bacterium]